MRTGPRTLVLAAALTTWGCQQGFCDSEPRADDAAQPSVASSSPASSASSLSSLSGAASGGDWFEEGAAAAGLDFVHFNGMSGEFYLAEILAPGVALFDYDGDGDLDVYLPQGQMLGAGTTLDAASFPPAPLERRDRLYRNDLHVGADGTRTLRFTDVTGESGIDARTYGYGVAAGDFTNDGWTDLYLTRFGRDLVYRNNGDGTFAEVSREVGIDDEAWTVSASFVDFDRDGWLDLYVGRYLRYTIENHVRCLGPSGAVDYCMPAAYQPQPDRLYRNRGNGTFADVTGSAGIGREFGPALGVITADLDRDGWVDIYVANDGQENQLWHNGRDGTFANVALLAGAAVPVHGTPEASMGVDAGDFDNDGDEDLFMTELAREGSNLYVNDGTGTFSDGSAAAGLGPASFGHTGFGAAWFDFDNDGWLDLLTVNGDVQIIQTLAQAGDPFPLHQPQQLFRNLGSGRFEPVTARAGAVFALSEVSRGAAFGDIDNDGDTDVVVANNNGPVRLIINNVGHRNHWLGLRLVGAATGPGPRDMLGTEVHIVKADGSTLLRRARADGSYGSANDPRVLVGLGESAAAVDLRVRWPDGRSEAWSQVGVDRYVTLIQGEGR